MIRDVLDEIVLHHDLEAPYHGLPSNTMKKVEILRRIMNKYLKEEKE